MTLDDGDGPRTVHLPAIPKPRTKNSIGYGFTPGGDVVDLFIGSEGTLGIVSEVTFRLMPIDESRLVFLQCLASAEQAFALVEALGATPAAHDRPRVPRRPFARAGPRDRQARGGAGAGARAGRQLLGVRRVRLRR